MATLITRTRVLIGDTNVACQQFSDDEIQDALDARRLDLRNQVLCAEATLGATVQYLTFQAELGDWETDVTLQNAHYDTVTPATSDYIRGRWTFTTEPDYPIFLSGKTYDLYGAAADLLETWATAVKLDFTFSPGSGKQFTRSQKHAMIMESAATYRMRERPRSAHQVRTDIGDGSLSRSQYERVLRR